MKPMHVFARHYGRHARDAVERSSRLLWPSSASLFTSAADSNSGSRSGGGHGPVELPAPPRQHSSTVAAATAAGEGWDSKGGGGKERPEWDVAGRGSPAHGSEKLDGSGGRQRKRGRARAEGATDSGEREKGTPSAYSRSRLLPSTRSELELSGPPRISVALLLDGVCARHSSERAIMSWMLRRRRAFRLSPSCVCVWMCCCSCCLPRKNAALCGHQSVIATLHLAIHGMPCTASAGTASAFLRRLAYSLL